MRLMSLLTKLQSFISFIQDIDSDDPSDSLKPANQIEWTVDASFIARVVHGDSYVRALVRP